jgi:hypothetical protein
LEDSRVVLLLFLLPLLCLFLHNKIPLSLPLLLHMRLLLLRWHLLLRLLLWEELVLLLQVHRAGLVRERLFLLSNHSSSSVKTSFKRW